MRVFTLALAACCPSGQIATDCGVYLGMRNLTARQAC